MRLVEIVRELDRLLPPSPGRGERTVVAEPGDGRVVRRLGFALEPWPGLAAWTERETLDALVLHRHWGLEPHALPPGLGVAATHAPFDERLGLGFNPHLARALALADPAPLGERDGLPLGMVGGVEPDFVDRLARVFGGLETVGPGPSRPRRAAVARAMTPELVHLAAAADADVYVTGELRATARAAVLEAGIAAVAVGHRRSETWSLGLLARLLADLPDMVVALAPDGTVPHIAVAPPTTIRAMTTTTTTFDAFFAEFAELVREQAASRGFTPAEEAVAVGRFGSRFAAFRRGAEALRLMWDGTEHWLVLEYRPMPEYATAVEWTGLLTERYDGVNIAAVDYERLRAGLLEALERVWRRRSPY